MTTREEIVERAEEAARTLLKQVNYMGMDQDIADAFAKVLMKEHNTIQQSFWRVLKLVAEQYGDMKYFDGRNEKAVEFAKEVAKIDVHLPFI